MTFFKSDALQIHQKGVGIFMMNYLLPVLLVAGIGLIAGLGLAIASILMAVPVNQKAQELREALPGNNCGACGYSGCDGYAEALANGAKNTGLCTPGGPHTAEKLASILGVEAASVARSAAVVRCRGTADCAKKSYDYQGADNCRMAAQLGGGPIDCKYGCIGLGDCVRACAYDAIRICNGVSVIDPAKCKACRMCVAACPKNLIHIASIEHDRADVLCRNQDKGGVTRKKCTAGCIGCMKCTKVCPEGAVTVTDFVASVDPTKCTGCGACAEACPTGCIQILRGSKGFPTSHSAS